MTPNQTKLTELLTKLPHAEEYPLQPATPEQIAAFRSQAAEQEVPQEVIDQLAEFYAVANDYHYEIVMAFHDCTSDILYEWWGDFDEILLGQRDMNILRWKDGKFCLGDASNASYGSAYEADTLVGLVEICIRDINKADYFKNKS